MGIIGFIYLLNFIVFFNSMIVSEYLISPLPLGWTSSSHSSFGYLVDQTWSCQFGWLLGSSFADTFTELHGEVIFQVEVSFCPTELSTVILVFK